jgi:hypothetical protein
VLDMVRDSRSLELVSVALCERSRETDVHVCSESC